MLLLFICLITVVFFNLLSHHCQTYLTIVNSVLETGQLNAVCDVVWGHASSKVIIMKH
jgi:hypothetical protein